PAAARTNSSRARMGELTSAEILTLAGTIPHCYVDDTGDIADSPVDGSRPSSAQHSIFEEIARMAGPSAHRTSRGSVRRDVRPLREVGLIKIPNGDNSEFDHAAFDPATRRVFIAHTARDCIEVIDHDTQQHIATLPGFPGVAGAVADDGEILTTNR